MIFTEENVKKTKKQTFVVVGYFDCTYSHLQILL